MVMGSFIRVDNVLDPNDDVIVGVCFAQDKVVVYSNSRLR